MSGLEPFDISLIFREIKAN